MNQEINLKKILQNKSLPKKIKAVLLSKQIKTGHSLVSRERIIWLYNLRIQSNENDEKYKNVHSEIRKMLSILDIMSDQNILVMYIL
jgi:hypothetical protein